MRIGLIQPWLIDEHLKLKSNQGFKPLAQIRGENNLKRSLWYKNLKACYERADVGVKQHGLTWYEDAYAFAQQLSNKYNVPIERVAQVIAALSPASKWERNKIDAEQLVASYYHRGYIGAVATTVTTYGPNKHKAINVLLGKQALTPDNGLKTYNFYNNILNPKNEFFVTIDRHAFNILSGNKKRGALKITAKDYYKACNVYRLLAKEKGLTPCQLQAITWVQYRNELNGNS